MAYERDVDAERLLYLLVLSFILDEIAHVYPKANIDTGSKLRALAERIASRLLIEADMMEILS